MVYGRRQRAGTPVRISFVLPSTCSPQQFHRFKLTVSSRHTQWRFTGIIHPLDITAGNQIFLNPGYVARLCRAVDSHGFSRWGLLITRPNPPGRASSSHEYAHRQENSIQRFHARHSTCLYLRRQAPAPVTPQRFAHFAPEWQIPGNLNRCVSYRRPPLRLLLRKEGPVCYIQNQ